MDNQNVYVCKSLILLLRSAYLIAVNNFRAISIFIKNILCWQQTRNKLGNCVSNWEKVTYILLYIKYDNEITILARWIFF